MNKYQREKAKRKKKLRSLGMSEPAAKQMIKPFKDDIEGLDVTLAAIIKIRAIPKMTTWQCMRAWIKGTRKGKHE
jgi:hypothetical protein